MRLFNGKIELSNWGIHWHPYGPQYKVTKNPVDIYDYACYIYPFPNWISKNVRHWGYEEIYYDGITHKAFGFWFFNVSWSF